MLKFAYIDAYPVSAAFASTFATPSSPTSPTAVAECMKLPDKSAEGMGVVYGMAQSIPDRSIVSDIACQYLNSIYDTSD